jgi:hypothetical protein
VIGHITGVPVEETIGRGTEWNETMKDGLRKGTRPMPKYKTGTRKARGVPSSYST